MKTSVSILHHHCMYFITIITHYKAFYDTHWVPFIFGLFCTFQCMVSISHRTRHSVHSFATCGLHAQNGWGQHITQVTLTIAALGAQEVLEFN